MFSTFDDRIARDTRKQAIFLTMSTARFPCSKPANLGLNSRMVVEVFKFYICVMFIQSWPKLLFLLKTSTTSSNVRFALNYTRTLEHFRVSTRFVSNVFPNGARTEHPQTNSHVLSAGKYAPYQTMEFQNYPRTSLLPSC